MAKEGREASVGAESPAFDGSQGYTQMVGDLSLLHAGEKGELNYLTLSHGQLCESQPHLSTAPCFFECRGGGERRPSCGLVP